MYDIFPFQQANSDMTVIAFLIFPTRTNNFNVESLRGQAIAKSLKDTVHQVQGQIGKRLFEICLRLVHPDFISIDWLYGSWIYNYLCL